MKKDNKATIFNLFVGLMITSLIWGVIGGFYARRNPIDSSESQEETTENLEQGNEGEDTKQPEQEVKDEQEEKKDVPAEQNAETPRPSFFVYTVKTGDNLWNIARDYKVKIQHLIDDNDLTSPYWLKAGQKLKIRRY